MAYPLGLALFHNHIFFSGSLVLIESILNSSFPFNLTISSNVITAPATSTDQAGGGTGLLWTNGSGAPDYGLLQTVSGSFSLIDNLFLGPPSSAVLNGPYGFLSNAVGNSTALDANLTALWAGGGLVNALNWSDPCAGSLSNCTLSTAYGQSFVGADGRTVGANISALVNVLNLLIPPPATPAPSISTTPAICITPAPSTPPASTTFTPSPIPTSSPSQSPSNSPPPTVAFSECCSRAPVHPRPAVEVQRRRPLPPSPSHSSPVSQPVLSCWIIRTATCLTSDFPGFYDAECTCPTVGLEVRGNTTFQHVKWAAPHRISCPSPSTLPQRVSVILKGDSTNVTWRLLRTWITRF